MSIRPISRRLPYTQATWDDSYLPFCFVTTPMGDIDALEASGDGSEGNSNADGNTIASIPKCLYCGAPHATLTTHFRFQDKLVCYLCGEVSSILLADQQETRQDEYLDPNLYNKRPLLSPQELREKKTDNANDAAFDFSTDTHEFRVPIVQQPGKHKEDIWQFPAMACPPVWWIVVDGTVGNTRSLGATRNYWATVADALSKAIEDIPPHVHVGLLTATGSRLASWDLTSAVPHVKQFPYSYDPGAMDGMEGDGADPETASSEPWDLCLVPAKGHYKANMKAAFRAMADGAMSGVFQEGLSDHGEDTEHETGATTSKYMPLGLTLEILLEFMEQANHPAREDADADADSNGVTKPRYAGGKILCLLGNPTLETGMAPSNDSLSYMGQSNFGLGGVAGSCRPEEDERRTKNGTRKEKAPKTDPTDMTASNLKDYAMPLNPTDMFADIGKQCAKAALGVDLIVLVPEEDDDVEVSETIPWYGLPLLRPLSDFSGAPGPLMFGTGNISSVEEGGDDEELSSSASYYVEKFRRLHENILARTPWQDGVVFGAQMKLRLSPGLKVEASPISASPSDAPMDMSQFLSSEGAMGPTAAMSEDEEEDGDGGKPSDEDDYENNLWVMGSCDPHTSLTIDLEVNGEEELPDTGEIEDFGLLPLKPVIQVCTLFFCVESDGATPTPNYFTVCKIRISSVTLDFAQDVEDVYDGIDPEALSLILFNKIALDAYKDGFVEAQEGAESWLVSMLVTLYASAQAEKDKLEEEEEEEEKDSSDNINLEFIAGDRLLDEEGGSLEEEEILMGEGHIKARHLPLMTYAIMQCDALRPCGNGYNPSMDARLCAITQMASMSPEALAKTFAPSLSLWSLQNDDTILDTLPLSEEGIVEALDHLGKEATRTSVLLLESPKGVLLFSASSMEEMGKGRRSNSEESTRRQPFTLGSKLKDTIETALYGYRTTPPQWKELEELLDNDGKGDLNELVVIPSDLRPMLVEDIPTSDGDQDFTEWKSRITETIRERIDEDEEDGKPGMFSGFFSSQ